MVLSYATCGNRDVLLRISRLALGSLNLVVKGAESKRLRRKCGKIEG